MKRKPKAKKEKLICAECADEIAADDTAGSGGCVSCRDGAPRCGECHEWHAAECEG